MKPARNAPLMTAEEYACLPEDSRRHELQLGMLLSEPQPFPRHAQVQARLAHALIAD